MTGRLTGYPEDEVVQNQQSLRRQESSFGSENDSSEGDSSSVQVAVRVRPLLAHESGTFSCIEVLPASAERNDRPSALRIGGSSGPTFTFDEVFSADCKQHEVFARRVTPLVTSCLQGYNATILAYGQTGSGKTHTIMGPSTATAAQDELSAGVIPRAIRLIFDRLDDMQNNNKRSNIRDDAPEDELEVDKNDHLGENNGGEKSDDWVLEYEIRVQFLELYGEDIRDLLTANPSGEKLTIRYVGMEEPEVIGATQRKVETAEEALSCLTRGMLRRVTAATAMNESSSRSHAILSVVVDQTLTSESSTHKEAQVKRSKFNFVDLAGSERQKRTRAEGQRLREGIDINKGLLVLGNVISALGDPKKRGKAFVPYRDSKLTRLLKGSLGGNHKTLMVACVSPSSNNMEESLNCLRYANRAKNIKNRAVVNMDAGSRLISELRTHVKALAIDLLQYHEGEAPAHVTFSKEQLQAMANSGSPLEPHSNNNIVSGSQYSHQRGLSPSSNNHNDSYGDNDQRNQFASSSSNQSSSPKIMVSPGIMGQQMKRLQETEDELNRTRKLLRKCRKESLSVDERLCVTKAEKECYRLQLAAHIEHDDSDPDSLVNEKEKLFIERATEYEKEIEKLREELKDAQIKIALNGMRSSNENPQESATAFSIDDATMDIESDRKHLAELQNHLLTDFNSAAAAPATPISRISHRSDSGMISNAEHAEQLDIEEKAEELQLNELTQKYIGDSDNDEEETEGSHNDMSPESKEAEQQAKLRQKQIEADLVEVSRIIDAKEELIKQLQRSQDKYASMETFYENKLHQMGQLLDEKEGERDNLIQEMRRLGKGHADSRRLADLKERIQLKDQHIAELRKKQRELRDLTTVSKRNEAEIRRLHRDVLSMKERKVSLQKELSKERKEHISEVRQLKKKNVQKDREVNKWKRMCDKKSNEALKAQQVAKARLGQIGALRSKFKDAEKKLRMSSLKRGVMEKVGLDPVIVGRRRTKKKLGSPSKIAYNPRTSLEKGTKTVDVDSLRDYFDQKVAEVGRKEAIADKLAEGWEEHFDLMKKRMEIIQDQPENGDSLLAIDCQIQYKEERVRQLASRLGKSAFESSKDPLKKDESQVESFLYDKEFGNICKGVSPISAGRTATKVLFGMVVRERRRIASLAKTASALDEKLQNVQRDAEAQEAAFRTYMDDQRKELMELSETHKDRIMSLMSLVYEGAENIDPSGPNSDDESTANSKERGLTKREDRVNAANSKMLAELAHEQISALERQVQELQVGQNVADGYRFKGEELRTALKSRTEDCQAMENQLSDYRSALRQIREAVSRPVNNHKIRSLSATDSDSVSESSSSSINGHNDNHYQSKLNDQILAVVSEALHPQNGALVNNMRRRSKYTQGSGLSDRNKNGVNSNNVNGGLLSPRLKKHVELMHTSDSEEEEGAVPEWADAIMSDLALIAEGKVPPSLQDSPAINSSQLESDDANGIAGNQVVLNNSIGESIVKARLLATPQNQKDRREMSQKVADTLDRVVSPAGNNNEMSDDRSGRRSVFDRLLSPSNYTGTQKEKYQHQNKSKQGKRIRSNVAPIAEDISTDQSEPINEKNDDKQNNLVVRTEFVDEGEHNNVASSTSPRKNIEEYTNQNVFERLTRTSTQSAAAKHASTHTTKSGSSSVIRKSSSSHHSNGYHHQEGTLPSQSSSQDSHHNSGNNNNSQTNRKITASKSSNVFERLTKTATEASSKKMNPPIEYTPHQYCTTHHTTASQTQHTQPPSSPHHQPHSASHDHRNERDDERERSSVPSSPLQQRVRTEEYTQQNVFDRLTKTTTQSYAVKRNNIKHV